MVDVLVHVLDVGLPLPLHHSMIEGCAGPLFLYVAMTQINPAFGKQSQDSTKHSFDDFPKHGGIGIGIGIGGRLVGV